MNFSRYFLVLLCIACGFTGLNAQMLKENELVVIKGEKFVLHQVRTGETVYSISRQYQVDNETLINNNPKLSEGLKIGDMLKIPYNEGTEWQRPKASGPNDPDFFEYYTISSRTETPYFIAKEFGITVEQIYAYNPEITRFRKGTRLRIPRWGVSPSSISAEVVKDQSESISDRELILYEVKSGESLKSVARKFNLSESEIMFFNPDARELIPGSVIHLPRPAGKQGENKIAGENELTGYGFTGKGTFFEHTIVSGETLWSLTRKYNVSEAELISMNPLLESGFPAGISIKIPVRESSLSSPEPVNEDAFSRHVVKAGETLYGLASRYNLSIPDIRRFNPQLESRNLVHGETLLIPKAVNEEHAVTETEVPDTLRLESSKYESRYYEVELPVVIPENCQVSETGLQIAATYNIALFLPLFIGENDNRNLGLIENDIQVDTTLIQEELMVEDTLIETDQPEELLYDFYSGSENYLKFYEGVLLAIDSLQNTGMKVVLNVMDTQQNADSIRKFIYSAGFLENDLIIGPVFPHVQDEVAAIAAKNRIPVVSPLSAQSRVINSNAYYYQVNPSRDFIITKTAELISEEYFNSNFLVVKTSNSGSAPEEKVVELVREKLTPTGYWNNPAGMLYHEVNFTRDRAGGLKRALSKEKENVVFVASMNEGDLSLVLSNLNNLVGEYPITLIGFNRYEQFRSIQEEFYHNLRLNYIAPYWVEYTHPQTVRFLKEFRRQFHTEPGNYGMQGYDVAFYFLNALKTFGKHFEECLPYLQVHLAQGSYSFEKQSSFGGYMNQGVSVISYEPDFEVVRKRVMGPVRFAQK